MVFVLLLFGSSTVSAQSTPPSTMVYVIDFGNRDLTRDAVSVIRSCCNKANALEIPADTLGCPSGIGTCEFLRLQEADGRFIIRNERSPADANHKRMMDRPIRYFARDDAGRRAELMKTLRSLITCHEIREHQGKGDPDNLETFCRRCGPPLAAPTVLTNRQ
jgi:hypothetical protein